MRFLRSFCLLSMPLVVAMLGACSNGGVGDGNRIAYLTVVNGANNAAIVPPFVAYQCLRNSVHLLATFTNGQIGDYTTRATWTSSDDSIVHVSNANKDILGDIVPSESARGLVYGAGTLIPGAHAGTAIITGTYVGLTATMIVQVLEPSSIFISKDNLFTPLPSLIIAPKSTQSLRMLGDLNGTGVLTDITSFALWSIPDDPNGLTATVSSSGLLSGINANPQSVTVQGSFDGCPTIPAGVRIGSSGVLSTTLTVTNLDHLILSSQQDRSAQPAPSTPPFIAPAFTSVPGNLFIGTTEAMTLLGYFSPQTAGKDPTIPNPNVPNTTTPDPTKYQDLSFQSNFYVDYSLDCPNLNVTPPPTTPTNVVELSFSPVAGLNNIVSALQFSSNPVHLSASFGVAPNQQCAGVGPVIGGGSFAAGTYPGGDIVRTVQNAVLDHFTIPAVNLNQTIAPGGTLQFYALGNFVNPVNANPIGTQDITRQITWSADVPSEVNISNIASTAGYATSLQMTPGCVNVVALDKAAVSTRSQTTQLQIGMNGNTSTPCLPPPPPAP